MPVVVPVLVPVPPSWAIGTPICASCAKVLHRNALLCRLDCQLLIGRTIASRERRSCCIDARAHGWQVASD